MEPVSEAGGWIFCHCRTKHSVRSGRLLYADPDQGYFRSVPAGKKTACRGDCDPGSNHACSGAAYVSFCETDPAPSWRAGSGGKADQPGTAWAAGAGQRQG